MPKLLAIDDEAMVLECYRRAFEDSDITVDAAGNVRDGVARFTQNRPDVVLLDVELPDGSGLEAFKQLRAIDAKVPVLFVTGGNTTESAIEAMKLGAFDYLLKPVAIEHLRQQVASALEVVRLTRVFPVVKEEAQVSGSPEAMIGRCAAMQEVYKAIGRVADQDVTVLVRGPSGTGKELVARAIYHHSQRKAGPFRAINCAAIPESLLESELFGHEKGAYTGAAQQRIGKFEQCRGGTLFLDEVGDMMPLTQTKMLRVLQEGEFERVGGNEVVHTDVRLVAATNRDLEQMVSAGQFREDLYYRLNIYAIHLPALRDRREDIPLLVEYFRRRFCRELRKEVVAVAPETMAMLMSFDWPGNIRELQSVLTRALLQTNGPVLLPQFLPEYVRSSPSANALRATFAPPAWLQFVRQRLEAGDVNLYAQWQEHTDRYLLDEVLRHTNGNVSHAARILGMNRGTLRTRMDALGLASGDA